MKAILQVFVILLSTLSFSPSQSVRVIASYCYLYCEPSFESEIVLEGDQPYMAVLGDTLTIVSDNDSDFALVSVPDTDISGYIYKYYITANSSQIVYPVFNGKTRRESVLYDLDKKPTEYTLRSGQEVYIYSGFDDDKVYTAVQVVLENGLLYNGYIKTSDLAPDGISPLLIAGIAIIVAGVTVILSLVLIKKTKKQKKLDKKQK